MFCAAVHTLVKAVGKETLIGVENLVVADDTKTLRVAIKKDRKWIWQSPKYFVTPFTLNEILLESDALDIATRKSSLLEYEQQKEFDIKGELGAKLCEEIMNVTLDLENTITLTAKCGAINKEELDVPALTDILKTKHLDFHHPLVKQVREDKRRVLCVITEVVYLENEGLLHTKMENKKSANVTAKLPSANIGSVEAKGDYEEEKDKAFKIPAGTPLAYAVCELVISKTGRIELVVVDGAHGGFGAYDDVDTSTSHDAVVRRVSLSELPVNEMYAGFIALETELRDELRHVIHSVMACTKLVQPLLKQLKRAYKAIDGTVATTTTVDNLRNDVSSDSSDWKPYLTFAGFTFSHTGEVAYPEGKTEMLESCRSLLEAMYEVDDETMKQIRKLKPVTGTAIVALMCHSISSTAPIDISIPGLSPLLEITDFLKDLGFKVADKMITPPQSNKHLQASYCIAFALWGC